MTKSKTDKQKYVDLMDWKDTQNRLMETKEAIITLAETGRKFPWVTALLLDCVEESAIDAKAAFEKLKEHDITTVSDAVRAAAIAEKLEGGAE
jgi:hypothetical protein